jgi:hypothetical protein
MSVFFIYIIRIYTEFKSFYWCRRYHYNSLTAWYVDTCLAMKLKRSNVLKVHTTTYLSLKLRITRWDNKTIRIWPDGKINSTNQPVGLFNSTDWIHQTFHFHAITKRNHSSKYCSFIISSHLRLIYYYYTWTQHLIIKIIVFFFYYSNHITNPINTLPFCFFALLVVLELLINALL